MTSTNFTALKKLAIRGAFWTIASYGAGQILRFGSNLILTRLLFPDLFGLMALVNIFIMGLQLFSDIGVGPSIIQNKRGDDPEFLNTAWTMQAMRGFGLWVGAVAIAYPIAQLYENPQLVWLIPIIGLTTIISGFNSTALFTCDRHLAVKQMVVFEVGSQIIALTVMIVWAWVNPTIWALIAGTLIASLVRMLWSHRLIPGQHNRFHWDKSAAEELFTFGKWIFISTALTFLAGQADRLILGKLFSLEMLGVYTIAFTLSDLPRQVVLAVSNKVIFPAVSRLAHLPRPEFRMRLLNSRNRILLMLAIGLAFLASFGDLVILVLYDDRYDQAAWMMPLLALGVWPNMLSQTIDPSLFAIGKPSYVALGNLFRFIFNLVGIPLGYSLFGIPGAIIFVVLNDVPFYGAIAFGLAREGLSCLSQDVKATLLFVGMLALLLVVRSLLGLDSPIAGML